MALGCRPNFVQEERPEGPSLGASTSSTSGAETGVDAPTGSRGTDDETTTGRGGPTGSEGSSEPPGVFDVAVSPDVPGEVLCELPEVAACDQLDSDPWHALGLNCPGAPSVEGAFTGAGTQLHVFSGRLGTSNPPVFRPREGVKTVVLSNGDATLLPFSGAGAPSRIYGTSPLADLPHPMTTRAVSEQSDCAQFPSLVGKGDCSNSLEAAFDASNGAAYDLATLQFAAEVPPGAQGIAFDFAFFTAEYPQYYGANGPDMFVAWLESEAWTGNVAFDDAGAPISVNTSFLHYKDAPNALDCPPPCEAAELSGTAMEGRGGTPWLTSQAPVTSGEKIELYFAVFDTIDGALDSVVMLDNVTWTCDHGPVRTTLSL